MKIGIIGTAGRKDDGPKLTQEVWRYMCEQTEVLLKQYPDSQLVSGGAAYADHIAVEMFRTGYTSKLQLHLPAPFREGRFLGEYGSDGATANYYHDLMSKRIGIKSLQDIESAKQHGAEFYFYSGFKERNLVVGQVDLLCAFTFGTHSSINTQNDPGWKSPSVAGLKDGGTAHTREHSTALTKIHCCL